MYGDEHGNPKDVFAIFFQRLEDLLKAEKDIVVDNTNIRTHHRRQILDCARKFNYADIELWILDVPLELCLQRNKARARQVEEEAMVRLFEDLNNRSWQKKT